MIRTEVDSLEVDFAIVYRLSEGNSHGRNVRNQTALASRHSEVFHHRGTEITEVFLVGFLSVFVLQPITRSTGDFFIKG